MVKHLNFITKSTFIVSIFSLLTVCNLTFAESVKIVSSLPRTGSANPMTSDVVNGIKLALEENNYKAGDINITYEDWDDSSPERGNWDPAVEAANADKAILDPSVIGYIIYNSGATKISQPKLNKAFITQMGFATWPGLTKPGLGEPNEPAIYRTSGKPGYFRLVPSDDIQGAVAARWALSVGAKTGYAIHDKELYGQGLATIFNKTATQLGIQMQGLDGIDPKASNYRSVATKIKSKNPDVIYLGGVTQTNMGQVVKDLRSVGVKSKIITPDGCFENSFIEAIGNPSFTTDVYVTFGGLPAEKLTGKGAEFLEKFKSKYKKVPEAYGSYGYETTLVLIDAIKRAKSTNREKIREAVAATKNFDGLQGQWSFDENGDTTSTTISLNKIANHNFEFVSLLK